MDSDIRTIIAELRELEARATKAPWVKSTVHPCIMEQRTTLDTMCMRDSGKNADANADFVLASRNALPRLLDYIARLEAVADAAEVVYAEWGEEEIACEFEEWRNLRSALDATNCDLKNGGAE